MARQSPIGERDRDRALLKLRWLTALSGIASFVVAAMGTSAAAQASTPSAAVRASGSGAARANPVAGSLSAEQLAALNFALPKPSTVVIWQPLGRVPAAAVAPAAGKAPAAAPAPRPAPTPPPAPVATSGTS